jgi:hypothetical protein
MQYSVHRLIYSALSGLLLLRGWLIERSPELPYMVLNAVITLVGLLLTAYDKVAPNFSRVWEQLVDLFNRTMGSDILESS